MKTLYKTLFFVLFLFSVTVNAQSILDRYEGIPIETSLDWDWVHYNTTAVDSMDSAGVDIVHISFDKESKLTAYFNENYRMDLLPITTPNGETAVYNWIQYYTDAKYSVWEAEGTQNNLTAKGNATLFRSPKTTIINNEYIRLDSNEAGDSCLMSYGPYYIQDIEYETYADGGSGSEKINYAADFNLMLECIGIDNAAPTDTLCILQVTQSTINTTDPFTIACPDTIFEKALTRSSFTQLNTFKPQKLGPYTLRPINCPPSINNVLPPQQYHYSTDFLLDTIAPGPRSMCERIEYRVIWTGNANYTLSYDKVMVYDGRGIELFGENPTFYRNLVIEQATSTSLTNYQSSIFGWLGIDEPQSIDQYEPIRVVKEILQSKTNSLPPLRIPFMDSWSGYWDCAENIW